MAEASAASAAAADGDPRTARERLQAAAELYGRAGQPYWTERTRRQADALAAAAGNGGGTPAS
jgi:hypothetical protein